MLFLEFDNNPVNQALVNVVATKVRVAIGGFHFHNAVAHFEDGNIEGAAAEIVYDDGFVLLLIQAVSEGSRSWLIDNAHHFQAGNRTGIFGGLALCIVEVSRNGDHGLSDFFAQISFSSFF